MPLRKCKPAGALGGEKSTRLEFLVWRSPDCGAALPGTSWFYVHGGGTVCAFLPCMSIWLAHSVNRRLKTDGRQQAGESRGATSVLDSVSPDPCDGCGSEELEEVSCESTFVEYRCPRCHYRLYRQRLG